MFYPCFRQNEDVRVEKGESQYHENSKDSPHNQVSRKKGYVLKCSYNCKPFPIKQGVY